MRSTFHSVGVGTNNSEKCVKQYCPPGVVREETIDTFRDAFLSLSFVVCNCSNHESGTVKIALFADEMGNPKHAARQLPNGRWTSKIGNLDDIEHELHDLEGSDYGSVVLVMKRSEILQNASNGLD